jgi:hypothetical protein
MAQAFHITPDTRLKALLDVYPAPLVDKVKDMGYASWSAREGAELVKTYFTRSSG